MKDWVHTTLIGRAVIEQAQKKTNEIADAYLNKALPFAGATDILVHENNVIQKDGKSIPVGTKQVGKYLPN